MSFTSLSRSNSSPIFKISSGVTSMPITMVYSDVHSIRRFPRVLMRFEFTLIQKSISSSSEEETDRSGEILNEKSPPMDM
jgi:hypothetical protein